MEQISDSPSLDPLFPHQSHNVTLTTPPHEPSYCSSNDDVYFLHSSPLVSKSSQKIVRKSRMFDAEIEEFASVTPTERKDFPDPTTPPFSGDDLSPARSPTDFTPSKKETDMSVPTSPFFPNIIFSDPPPLSPPHLFQQGELFASQGYLHSLNVTDVSGDQASFSANIHDPQQPKGEPMGLPWGRESETFSSPLFGSISPRCHPKGPSLAISSSSKSPHLKLSSSKKMDSPSLTLSETGRERAGISPHTSDAKSKGLPFGLPWKREESLSSSKKLEKPSRCPEQRFTAVLLTTDFDGDQCSFSPKIVDPTYEGTPLGLPDWRNDQRNMSPLPIERNLDKSSLMSIDVSGDQASFSANIHDPQKTKGEPMGLPWGKETEKSSSAQMSVVKLKGISEGNEDPSLPSLSSSKKIEKSSRYPEQRFTAILLTTDLNGDQCSFSSNIVTSNQDGTPYGLPLWTDNRSETSLSPVTPPESSTDIP